MYLHPLASWRFAASSELHHVQPNQDFTDKFHADGVNVFLMFWKQEDEQRGMVLFFVSLNLFLFHDPLAAHTLAAWHRS